MPDPDEKEGYGRWPELIYKDSKGDPFPTETNASMILNAKDEIDLVDLAYTKEDFLQATRDIDEHDLNYEFSLKIYT